MNDLFSGSFKKYQDLKRQIHVDDIETGGGGTGNETIDLDRFFEDVEKVKDDMKDVEKLYKRLQELNEETKTAHNAKAVKELRSRMDSDVAQVLKRVKVIKGKLEALDRSNVAHRSIPGCGPGSSADRTRTSVVSGLGKKLKVMMDEFQASNDIQTETAHVNFPSAHVYPCLKALSKQSLNSTGHSRYLVPQDHQIIFASCGTCTFEL